MTLISTDYNEEYFISGYPLKRWYRNLAEFPEGTGEYYKDRAKKIFDTYNLQGKKVLDIGCGFGFTVADLREMGADAYGIDFSEYAVGVANSPYVTLADARTYVKNLKVNEYDLIIMTEFLCCLTDTEITQLVKDVGKKAKQFFIIERRDFSETVASLYTVKTLEEWQTLFPNIQIVMREEESVWQR